MPKAVRIDYALAMAAGLGGAHGPDDDALDGAEAGFAAAREATLERVAKGELGFWGLPDERETLSRVDAWAETVPDSIRDVIVLGIGGSSLGARAILHALGGKPLERNRGNPVSYRNRHWRGPPKPWRGIRKLELGAPIIGGVECPANPAPRQGAQAPRTKQNGTN